MSVRSFVLFAGGMRSRLGCGQLGSVVSISFDFDERYDVELHVEFSSKAVNEEAL